MDNRISVTLNKGQRMTFTFSNTISLFYLSKPYIHQILLLRHKNVLRKPCLSNFPYKSITYQSLPCHILGKGQCRVNVWTNFARPEWHMQHIKFQGHWPLGFLWFYHNWTMIEAILVIWPRPSEHTLAVLSHGGSTWNVVSISLVASEEMFENGVCVGEGGGGGGGGVGDDSDQQSKNGLDS